MKNKSFMVFSRGLERKPSPEMSQLHKHLIINFGVNSSILKSKLDFWWEKAIKVTKYVLLENINIKYNYRFFLFVNVFLFFFLVTSIDDWQENQTIRGEIMKNIFFSKILLVKINQSKY